MKRLYGNTAIQTIGATTGIAGAVLVALNINMFLIAYFLFLTSSVFWGIFAHKTANTQLLLMNIVFSAINMMGIYNYS